MDDYTIRRIEECLAHPAFHRAATVQEHADACAILAGACNPVAIRELLDRLKAAETEVAEQARLLGISGSVEARLLARVAELEWDAERWRTFCEREDILNDIVIALETYGCVDAPEAERGFGATALQIIDTAMRKEGGAC